MAGRAGRLSHTNNPGRVVYFAQDAAQLRAAPRYLSWWEFDQLSPQIHPTSFSQLSLQMLAAGVANSADSLAGFLQETFSAAQELNRNRKQPELWRDAVDKAVTAHVAWGFVR